MSTVGLILSHFTAMIAGAILMALHFRKKP